MDMEDSSAKLSVARVSQDSDELPHYSQPNNEALSQSEKIPSREDRQFSDWKKLLSKTKDFVGCTDKPPEGRAELRKDLTVWSGVGLITGGIIGSGIFITPRKIFENTGSFGLTMVLWVMGALIALAGGLCYIELAAVVRKSGGEYPILLTAYSFNKRNKFVETLGKVVAFLYAWAAILVIRSLSVSIILLTCARYFTRPFYIDCEAPRSVVTTLALSLLLLVALVNSRSVKFTARVISILSSVKVLALAFITLVGFAYVIANGGFSLDAQEPFKPNRGHEPTVFSVSVGLIGVVYSYNGWSIMNYAVEETKDVGRTLPLSLGIGIPIVAVCYLLVNVAYFGVLCYEEVLSGDAIALVFGHKALGTAGLVVVPLLVTVSTLGASMGTVYGASRVMFASARDGLFPQVLSGLHKTYRTPIPALMLQVVLSSVGIMMGDISTLVDGHSAVEYLFYLLAFISVFILRFTHGGIKRLFPAWFILPVALFAIIVSIFIVVFPVAQKPKPLVVAYGMTLSGLLVYPLFIAPTPWKHHLTRISGHITHYASELLNLEISASPLLDSQSVESRTTESVELTNLNQHQDS